MIKRTRCSNTYNKESAHTFPIRCECFINNILSAIPFPLCWHVLRSLDGLGCMKPTLKVGKVEVINPQIASKKNIKLMQETLEHVVSRGLGRKAGTPLILVAGKTGTSHVNEYYEGEAFVTEYQLAFCGYFPADAPKYSMIVSMNKLGLPASGGGMAGALFHEITEWMITHDMPPVLMIDKEKNDTIRITEDNIKSITGSQ